MRGQDAITEAAARLVPLIRPTPVLTVDEGLGAPVTFKLEFLQHSGSFKVRGAFNKLLSCPIPDCGVVAASGGNHGAAVAFAAERLGTLATIFVPTLTPLAKTDRIRAHGATVIQGGATYAEALEACERHQARTGALGVHAYDDEAVLAGQGTVGRELAAEAPGLTHVLVATGGGGLVGGIAAWYEGSGVTIVAVEPHACPTLHQALAAGMPVRVSVAGIAADSLGARVIGGLSYAIAVRTCVVSVLVDDAAIAAAQLWLWDRMRIVAEPGGATALAALLSGAWTPPAGSRVGIVLCGANTDAPRSLSA